MPPIDWTAMVRSREMTSATQPRSCWRTKVLRSCCEASVNRKQHLLHCARREPIGRHPSRLLCERAIVHRRMAGGRRGASIAKLCRRCLASSTMQLALQLLAVFLAVQRARSGWQPIELATTPAPFDNHAPAFVGLPAACPKAECSRSLDGTVTLRGCVECPVHDTTCFAVAKTAWGTLPKECRPATTTISTPAKIGPDVRRCAFLRLLPCLPAADARATPGPQQPAGVQRQDLHGPARLQDWRHRDRGRPHR